MRKCKLPRAAMKDLVMTAEFFGKFDGESAGKILKTYLSLMDKYSDYFFSEPWQENYDYEKAATFTEADKDFLAANKEEFNERWETVLLKKNLFLNGFMGPIGIMWTQTAYHEQFVRPKLIPVGEAFLKHAESSDDAHEVLEKLKSEFQDVAFIHDGLVDYREINYPDKQKDKLLARILEAIHTVEGLECGEYMCRLQRENLHKPPSPYAESLTGNP